MNKRGSNRVLCIDAYRKRRGKRKRVWERRNTSNNGPGSDLVNDELFLYEANEQDWLTQYILDIAEMLEKQKQIELEVQSTCIYY